MAKLSIQLSASMEKLRAGLKNAQKAVADWKTKVARIGKVAIGVGAGALAAGLAAAAKRAVELAANFQQTQVAFRTMVGDSQKAAALIDALTEFSTKTPFTPEQVQKAAKTLLAFGFAAEDVKGTMKLLGDVSAGTGKDLSEMAVIFGQIKSAGRLMGQDLLQLINAGFNPLQVMSEKTGKSMAQLKDEMSKGLVTFEDVRQAFVDATSAGGIFFNMMEEQSRTVGGKLSTLKGNFDKLLTTIGSGTTGELSRMLDALNKIVSAWDEIAEAQAQATANGAGGDAARNLAISLLQSLPVPAQFEKLRQEKLRELLEQDLAAVDTQQAPPTSTEVETGAEAARAARFADINKAINKQLSSALGAEVTDFDAISQVAGRFNLPLDEVADMLKDGTIRIADLMREFGGEFGIAIDDLADEDFAEPIGIMFERARKEILKKAAQEVERIKLKDAREDARRGLREAIDVNRERAAELEKQIGAAFRPQGEIASNLSRIGGERGIAVARNIPEKQLAELKAINDGIKIMSDALQKIDATPVWPGGN